MLTVSVSYTPRLSEAEQALLELPGRLRNLEPVVSQAIAPAADAMLRRHWETQGRAFGHPWKPLAPSTLAERIRKGTANKGPLRDTDTLFRAVFSSAARRIARTATGVRLSLMPDDPKWMFHQLGTRRMPQRQVIPQPLPRTFRDVCREFVRDYVRTGRARGAAGRFVAISSAQSAGG